MVQSNQKTLSREQIENALGTSIYDSLWIDGLQHQVCIRPNALPEVIMFLDINEEIQHSKYIMKTYLLKLNIFHNNHILNQGYDNDCDEEMWNTMKTTFLLMMDSGIYLFQYFLTTIQQWDLNLFFTLCCHWENLILN